jgi:prepilin-type N-terminal cleavage/methylation domain-containing protein
VTSAERSERGFTLIELMVALVVSSLLVGMILAIFNRMSMAYRGQQQIAGVQQVLAAARATVELDAKQAGLELSQGFRYAADAGAPPAARSPVRVIDNPTGLGPDQIAFFYADPTTQAAVTGGAMPTVNVDATTGFAVGDLVVMSRVDTTTAGVNAGVDANLASYEACVLKVTAVTASPARLTFDTAAPWGRVGETHCTMALSSPTMIYKFVARGYKIDTVNAARAALGPLQLSQTGGLIGTAADNWTDLAYGFTDIQSALQVYDHTSAPGDTPDSDADGDRDWFSDGTQTTLTGLATTLSGTDGLLQMSISLVARTDRTVEGIATAATPNLIDPAIANNNTIGNHASVALPSATDPALGGAHIYRFTTFTVDLRNLGVGR